MTLDWYEIFGFVTGVLCVTLLIRQNIWNWPVAIGNAVFYIIVFYNARLYADVVLQFFFIGINTYGWIAWLRRGPQGETLHVNSMDKAVWLWSLLAIAAGTTSLGAWLHYNTDAALPYADAFGTATSLTAQFLMARKKWENWILWIAINIWYIGLYFVRDLYLTQVLYVIYLGLAIAGLIEWRRAFRNPKQSLNN